MSDAGDELNQIRAAIAAHENLRGVVEDDIIETTLAALRKRMAELESADQARQRRLVTILFMDTVGSTALIRDLDPEVSLDIMEKALSLLTAAIEAHGGRVTRYMGDGFKAVFGLPSAHENDAEMAVRAGLALLEVARAYAQELGELYDIHGYRVRVGIHTGWVAVGGLSGPEGAIMGATVNLAARMETAAEPDTVLISQDTYQHIRGVFDVEALDSIVAKGFAEPTAAYRVLGVKPSSYRTRRRGIEGIETRMIGRDHELGMLQDAYLDTFETAETRVVTVVGEAGVGKSRLMYEFDDWLELRSESVRYFRGRAIPYLQNVPNGLFRNLFALRYDIREADSAAVALEKFRTGTAGILAPDYADVLGHWLGFNFSDSKAVSKYIGSAEFSGIARGNLTRYFRELASSEPVVILLEDIQWADNHSLDLVNYLVAAIPAAHLLIVPAARHSFFERRPHWGEGQSAYSRIELKPLSRRMSNALVDEILQQVDNIPPTLRDKVVDGAEGNPLYVEEQVKALIDQGIVEVSGGHWHVLAERLEFLNVPSTLGGLLQARLDGLPRQEREMLQRASVIGRTFWNMALAALSMKSGEEVQQILEAVRERELIFRRESSTFGGTVEYIFKHNLLRDVAYETVLLEQRAVLHSRTARWLESSAGERLEESLGLIAGHYELAGEPVLAAGYFGQAAKSAYDRFALNEALTSAEKAVALLTNIENLEIVPLRLQQYLLLGRVIGVKGDLRKARELLETRLPDVRHHGDPSITVHWLRTLASANIMLGDFNGGNALLVESLALARQVDDPKVLFEVLIDLGHLGWRTDMVAESVPYVEESLALAEASGDRRAVGRAIMLKAFHAEMLADDWVDSLQLHRQVEAIGRETGDAGLIAQSLNNEGYVLYHMGKYQSAIDTFKEAMVVEREVGWDQGISYTACRMAMAQIQWGYIEEARDSLKEGLQLALTTGRAQTILYGLLAHALLRLKVGEVTGALELVGMVQSHPGYVILDHGEIAQEILDEAREYLPADAVQAALESGSSLEFDRVLTGLLSEERRQAKRNTDNPLRKDFVPPAGGT